MDSHSPSVARTAGNQPADSGVTFSAIFGTTGAKTAWNPKRAGRRESYRHHHRRSADGHGHHS